MIEATILLCDWAEVVAGKLYAQGIGWAQTTANLPAQMAVAVLVTVPYDQTNQKHRFKIELLTEDGAPFPADPGIEFGFDFEVGRPPGMKAGQVQIVPFAGKVAGPAFPPGGYTWRACLDDEPIASVSFTSVVRAGG